MFYESKAPFTTDLVRSQKVRECPLLLLIIIGDGGLEGPLRHEVKERGHERLEEPLAPHELGELGPQLGAGAAHQRQDQLPREEVRGHALVVMMEGGLALCCIALLSDW